MASVMFCGKFVFFVSGRIVTERIAAMMAGTPNTTIGSGFQTTAKFATKGHTSPNSLATKEQVPMACVLRLLKVKLFVRIKLYKI